MQSEVELTVVPVTDQTVPAEPIVVSVVEKKSVNDASPKTEEEKKEAEPAVDASEATPNKEWTNAESFSGASFFSTIQNIANTVIGAGILSIAFSIMKAGVAGSIILIIAVLIPSIMTSYYLSVATIYTNEFIYGDIGSRLCNKFVGVCANITQVLLDFGINVAYMNVFFNQIIDISNELFGLDLTKYKIVCFRHIFFITLDYQYCRIFPHSIPSHFHQDHYSAHIRINHFPGNCHYLCPCLYCYGY